jgi:hypothetical protein
LKGCDNRDLRQIKEGYEKVKGYQKFLFLVQILAVLILVLMFPIFVALLQQAPAYGDSPPPGSVVRTGDSPPVAKTAAFYGDRPSPTARRKAIETKTRAVRGKIAKIVNFPNTTILCYTVL